MSGLAPGRAAAAVILASTLIAACGSDSTRSSSSSGGSGSTRSSSSSGGSGSTPSRAQASRDGLSFARCMRSHGVSAFPDPSSNGGGFNLNNVAGISPSAPAFKAAQTACKNLMPVKRPPSGPPSAQAHARLLHWAKCMRGHGISGLPDPKPDPPPSPGSPGTAGIGTLMGDGGFWVRIPASIDAHSPAFLHLSTVCGESPTGHRG